MSEVVVLSFEDMVLYDNDIALFKAPNWLNDACLQFAGKRLERLVPTGVNAIAQRQAIEKVLEKSCEKRHGVFGKRDGEFGSKL